MKPPPSQLPFWPRIAVIAVVIPGMFWVGTGEWGLGMGLAAFLILLLIAAQYLPEMGQKYAAEQAAVKAEPSWFDLLGVIWLLAIPFAPLAAWLIDSLSTLTVRNWRTVLGAEAILC